MNDSPFLDEDIELLESIRRHPAKGSMKLMLRGPGVICPRCGTRRTSLTRPWWREDGPMQCQSCNLAEKAGDISNPGSAEKARREALVRAAAARKDMTVDEFLDWRRKMLSMPLKDREEALR